MYDGGPPGIEKASDSVRIRFEILLRYLNALLSQIPQALPHRDSSAAPSDPRMRFFKRCLIARGNPPTCLNPHRWAHRSDLQFRKG